MPIEMMGLRVKQTRQLIRALSSPYSLLAGPNSQMKDILSDGRDWAWVVTNLFHFVRFPKFAVPTPALDAFKSLYEAVLDVANGRRVSVVSFPNIFECALDGRSLHWLRRAWDGASQFVQCGGDSTQSRCALASVCVSVGLLQLRHTLPLSAIDPRAKYGVRRRWGEKYIDEVLSELRGRAIMSDYLTGSPDSVTERRKEEISVFSKSLERLKWKETPRDVYSSSADTKSESAEDLYRKLLEEMGRVTVNLFSEERISSLLTNAEKGEADAEVRGPSLYFLCFSLSHTHSDTHTHSLSLTFTLLHFQRLWQTLSSLSLSSLLSSFAPYRDILHPFVSACYTVKYGIRIAMCASQCNEGRSRSILRLLSYPRSENEISGEKGEEKGGEGSYLSLKRDLSQSLSDVSAVKDVRSTHSLFPISLSLSLSLFSEWERPRL